MSTTRANASNIPDDSQFVYASVMRRPLIGRRRRPGPAAGVGVGVHDAEVDDPPRDVADGRPDRDVVQERVDRGAEQVALVLLDGVDPPERQARQRAQGSELAALVTVDLPRRGPREAEPSGRLVALPVVVHRHHGDGDVADGGPRLHQARVASPLLVEVLDHHDVVQRERVGERRLQRVGRAAADVGGFEDPVVPLHRLEAQLALGTRHHPDAGAEPVPHPRHDQLLQLGARDGRRHRLGPVEDLGRVAPAAGLDGDVVDERRHADDLAAIEHRERAALVLALAEVGPPVRRHGDVEVERRGAGVEDVADGMLQIRQRLAPQPGGRPTDVVLGVDAVELGEAFVHGHAPQLAVEERDADRRVVDDRLHQLALDGGVPARPLQSVDERQDDAGRHDVEEEPGSIGGGPGERVGGRAAEGERGRDADRGGGDPAREGRPGRRRPRRTSGRGRRAGTCWGRP